MPKLGWVGFDPANGICADRRPCPRRGRPRLSRRGPGPRHPLWRRRRDAGGRRQGRPGRPAEPELRQAGAGRHPANCLLELRSASSCPRQNAGLTGSRGRWMTYCCGILVREGLVMIADTRTNAGLDNISTFRKLHVFEQPGERIMAIASAGNLSISQSVISHPDRGLREPGDRRGRDADERADHVPGGAARSAAAIREVNAIDGKALQSEPTSTSTSRSCSAARSRAARLRLFMIYAAGNFIECTHRHALPADRRAQIRQADPRPRGHLRHRPLRRAEDRPDLDGFDHALESRRRPADRHRW